MYVPWRSRRSSSEDVDDTFHQVYVPLLRTSLKISIIKYICLLVYCIRSMQEHLSIPTYCNDPSSPIRCSSSSCYWLHKVVLNLPRFMINEWFFVEQCAYLLIFFFTSCSLFLYSVYLVKKEHDLKIRYRAILTLPSMFFELIICFLSYYATITSIFEYSKTAKLNPNFHSSAFIIFAFIISLFYAILIVIHFSSLYYIMIYPVVPLSVYTVSNANYSTMNYGQMSGGSGSRSQQYEPFQAMPLMNDSYRLSINNWQTGNDARGTVSSYSQIRSWNNTLRSTNTLRAPRETILREDDSDYLELV
ncbi:hypothetical protein CRE_03613 [Caenorhabditis remanei]|uniref:Uncharacterized protein n=1 Tax=Caenorhabditis remanei TaxID=31234 RepID=E3LX89_CAERE|nr:hypothetical protein CRE_03613 [Caenorhabditis remanei]